MGMDILGVVGVVVKLLIGESLLPLLPLGKREKIYLV
jgi:hypothetical protein